MYRLIILVVVALQGCSHLQNFSNSQFGASASNSNPIEHADAATGNQQHEHDDGLPANELPPNIETLHISVFDDFFNDVIVAPMVLPHSPNGWLVEDDHKPLPVEVVKIIDQPSDLIERIRSGFTFDLEQDNKRIRAQLNWYLRNPEYVNRVITRSSRYLHYIVERLEQENMPLELALLPVVESAFNAFAYSHGRASGLWQFIPGTGKMYGMNQSWWFDGRRDVILSTEGAIKYLTWLNQRFDGNWLHALASYNTGSGRVKKSIRRNAKQGKPTDFWSLRLPRETRAYVPKLIAIAKIVADPAKYNMTLNSVPNQPYFETVQLDSQIDLAQAANLAEIDIEEIYQLNPGLNQWATPPTGPFRLLLPKAVAGKFAERVSALPKDQRLTWDSYKVKRGDALGNIARKFHTTPSLIRQVNNLRGNTILLGQSLLIPVASQSKTFYGLSEQNRIASIQTKVQGKNGASKVFYKVKTGDTFWDIARAHKVGVRQLAKWNAMAPGDVLRPGKRLLIWSNTAGKRATAKQVKTIAHVPSINRSYAPRDSLKRLSYRVRRGDSLWLIASRFNVSIKELKQWNKIGAKKYIQPGQRLTVFVDITQG